MKIETVRQMWDDFARHAFKGINPSPVQVQEMRRAFYAGVSVILLHNRDTIGHESLPVDAGVKILQGWLDECESFCRDLKEGRA